MRFCSHKHSGKHSGHKHSGHKHSDIQCCQKARHSNADEQLFTGYHDDGRDEKEGAGQKGERNQSEEGC